MDVYIGKVPEERETEWFRMTERGFGNHVRDDELAVERAIAEMDRALAAFDGQEMVGSAAAYSLDVTVPGGVLPMAGVTSVAVLPTHRRRGVLTQLMRRQLEDVRQLGEPLAGLWASEGSIYQRFGYGLSTLYAKFSIDRDKTRFVRSTGAPPGRMRIVERDVALKEMPPIYERERARRPGMVSRPGAFWTSLFADLEHDRDGASAYFYAMHESARGDLDGYVVYRVKGDWPHGWPAGKVEVEELMAEGPEAYAELWRYCFDIDLIASIDAWKRPADEPLLFMLAEPRRLGLTLGDGVWLRLVDVGAALSSRTYGTEGSLVLEVRDSFCPWNEGRVKLTSGPEGAECAATKESADLDVDVADLGSAFLGGVGFTAMVAAGRVKEHTPGAAQSADAMFRSDPLPWCPHIF